MCAIVPLLGPCLCVCLLLSASGEDENNHSVAALGSLGFSSLKVIRGDSHRTESFSTEILRGIQVFLPSAGSVIFSLQVAFQTIIDALCFCWLTTC